MASFHGELPMSDKERVFLHSVATGATPVAAAVSAGYRGHDAAAELLRRPVIRSALQTIRTNICAAVARSDHLVSKAA